MSAPRGSGKGRRDALAANGAKAGEARPPVGELVFALVIMLIVVSIFIQGLALPLFQPDGTIGPGFFPVSLSVIVLAIVAGHTIYLGAALARRRSQRDDSAIPGGIVTHDQFILTGLILLAVLIGDRIGLLAASGMVLLAGLLFIERVGLRASVLFTLGTLASVYLIFDLWLGMNVGLRALF
ncbi:tripartite tricarboxylate transporter TctB family protein [Chelativorans sp. AA-79]|uniref:tripartite tricarboxylate transporter TctB family protein n=1 Tax=Chelativorans sp. AA-79 TaxID=3028735 RepID=UPI0023F695B0|nr:tripartite tricarboxylate transporter TctB family protein [Chelativorans sp. AA-79]WEX10769.1 tripartite tricarboxylate transporter TctB family protein [Chelativorans sp. AA-79]